MSAADRDALADRLAVAVYRMASRYGIACMEIGYAESHAEREAARKATFRRYSALLRLTGALANIAGGAR